MSLLPFLVQAGLASLACMFDVLHERRNSPNNLHIKPRHDSPQYSFFISSSSCLVSLSVIVCVFCINIRPIIIIPIPGLGHHKKPEHVIAGLKATIHNPRVSEEAKEHAVERLQEMGVEVPADAPVVHHHDTSNLKEGNDSKHFLGIHFGSFPFDYGLTYLNLGEHASDETKEHAREILEAAGYHVEKPETSTEEEHMTRVLAGYKAAIHSKLLIFRWGSAN